MEERDIPARIRTFKMKETILQHYKIYPRSELQDFFKLIHQSEFGPGHLVVNPKENFKHLAAEYENLAETSVDQVIEILQPQLCRLHLEVLRQTTLSIKTLQKFFEISAREKRGDIDSYLKKISELKELCSDGSLPFTENNVERFVTEKIKPDPTGLFRHSRKYREAYAPAYRVVEKRFCDVLPLFARIDDLMHERKQIVIAIDGDCAAGKTTLSHALKEVYNCNIIPIDHFFLRPEQRTDERLTKPGGNIDHERFIEEVLNNLNTNKDFSYQPFNCMIQNFDAPVLLSPEKLTIIEGSYSHHPFLAERYDLKIFLSIPEDVQLNRILKRNGMTMYDKFKNIWIPMEKKYAAALGIKERSDLQFYYLNN